jgi:hypothetical protein
MCPHTVAAYVSSLLHMCPHTHEARGLRTLNDVADCTVAERRRTTWIPGTLGSQFTCFTGTKVQILTQLPEALQEVAGLQEE